MNLIQRLMAHGFAGCCCELFGALALGVVAWMTCGIWDSSPPATSVQTDYIAHATHWVIVVVLKVIHVFLGTVFGALIGFLTGIGLNTLIVARSRRPSNEHRIDH